jgi:hypothetical protein
VFNAVYGLSISFILKRFGAMTRTLVSTVAIVLNAVLDTAVFHEKMTVLEVTTFLTIFGSIFLFTIIGDNYNKLQGPSKAEPPKPEQNTSKGSVVVPEEKEANAKGETDTSTLLGVANFTARARDDLAKAI